MKLTTKKFDPKEHELLLNQFLISRGLSARTSLAFLPPTGVVVYNYEQPICIGFLIKSDNGTGECSDFISDPTVPKMLRHDAVQYMRKYFELEAKKSGLKVLTAYCMHPRHIERLKSLGYVNIQQNLTHLGRFLWLSQD